MKMYKKKNHTRASQKQRERHYRQSFEADI